MSTEKVVKKKNVYYSQRQRAAMSKLPAPDGWSLSCPWLSRNLLHTGKKSKSKQEKQKTKEKGSKRTTRNVA